MSINVYFICYGIVADREDYVIDIECFLIEIGDCKIYKIV